MLPIPWGAPVGMTRTRGDGTPFPVRVVLLQCELEHRHQAPHLAGALFAADLRARGHHVRCALVHPSALDAAAERFADAELFLLDSIFPFGLVRRLQARTAAPLVLGGHNALQHVLRGPAELALVGAARRTVVTLVEGLEAGAPLGSLPGLWFARDGRIDCGPPAPAASLESELLPFRPDLDWDYLGPPRAPGSNLRIPSVVGDVGCVWNRTALTSDHYRGVAPRLPEIALTERAAARLQAEFVDREGGCTFCTFRYLRGPGGNAAATGLVVEQARVLMAAGARGLSLQTEHPLPWLVGLLDALGAAGLTERLDALHVRTIPWLLLRHADALRAAISRARDLGVQLVLAQVGFEGFDATTLAVYNKGLSVEDNRSAARLLTALHAENAPGFVGIDGHGLVPLHPWSTPEALRATIAACRQDAPWLLPSLTPGSRIELYTEWTPLFWKAQDDGLLVDDPRSFGWGWRFADARMGEVCAAATAIDGGAEALDAVAAIVLEEPDPEARRAAYLRLRDRAPGV